MVFVIVFVSRTTTRRPPSNSSFSSFSWCTALSHIVMTQNEPDGQSGEDTRPTAQSDDLEDYSAQLAADREARSRGAIEAHRRRRERLEQKKKDGEEREYYRKEVVRLRAERDEIKAIKVARGETATASRRGPWAAAPELALQKDISNPTSSSLSDMADSAMQECNPVDSAETRRQSAGKGRVSPAATERESAATRRQEKLTSENTSCSKPVAPTADKGHRTTQSVVLQARMPATAEVAATCSCAADLEKSGEAIKDAKEKLDKVLKDFEDVDRRVERHNKLLLALRDGERLSGKRE
ncbi:hypothetical protein THARTR1_03951 [Trichoderma harzianum]|uniref:Uncharacterized protein n=1 Tax=Trichoderma harzianum TaxID=5544 RepID=A0A2K0UE05_TRIHA|nr:hypothetical protein THARTR1_03951 [Trichoderma harzianum]